MILNKTTTWVTLTLLLAIVMKWLHMQSDTVDLVFILYPVQAVVQLAFNTYSTFDTAGFHFEELGIVIDKSCSGANFFILCFSVLSATIPYYRYPYSKAAALFASSLLFSFGVTLVVNLSRITVAIALLQMQPRLPWIAQPWVHEAEGIFIYLSALLCAYLLVNHYFSTTKNHDTKHSSSEMAVTR